MEKKRLQHISLLLFLTYFLNLCVPCLAVQAEAIFAPVSLTEEVTFDLLTEKSSSPDSFTEAEATLASPEESFIGDASFGDIAGHWAENGIKAWTVRELASGYPDGTFRPDSPITRAEFLTLVNRVFSYMAGGQASSPADYRDVAETDWYAGEIAKAAAVGYLGGYPDGTVKPQNPITRQEAAALFAKILPPANFDKDKNEDSNNDTVDSLSDTKDKFTDQAQIPEWSQVAIATAVNGGYMNGYPDGTFQPIRPITRAEAISVLDRAIGTLYNHAGTYGSSQGTTLLEGNVTINTTGVTLQNTTITGNLYLTEGIGEGDVTLNNVTVQGTTKISGGGSNSIHLLNTTVGAVLVNVPSRNLVRLLAQGSTAVGTLEARTPARLEEEGLTGSGFTKVVVNTQQAITAPGITIELLGNFGEVEIQSTAAQLDLQKGRIQNLTLASTAQAAQIKLAAQTGINTLTADTPAIVQGQGAIEMLEANVDGVVVEAPAKNVILEDGVQATVEGKIITESIIGAETKKKKSKDATLSDLAIDGETVVGFAPDTLEYTVVLPYGTKKAAEVTATARHAKAQVEITQAAGLTDSDNIATVLVTAENGSTQTYTVNFTVALNSAKEITGFRFTGLDSDVVGTIVEEGRTIALTVPYGTSVTALTPTITHTGASISPASGVKQDFTESVTYTVTAANETTAEYVVTVTVAKNTAASLTSLAAEPGTIAFEPGTFTYDDVEVPYGTKTVEVSFMATAGATTDLASPQNVSITDKKGTFSVEVTAEDGTTTQTYTLNFVEADPGTEATLKQFTIGGQNVLGLPNVTTTGATLAVSDFTGFQGIAVEATDAKVKSIEVTLNGTVVSEEKLATQVIAANDVIIVTVVAENGIAKKEYKVTAKVLAILSLSANPSVGGTVTGGGEYTEGTSVTVNALAEQGYEFTNWTAALNTVVSTESSYTFVMPAETVNLTANFRKLSTEAEITAFSFTEQTGLASINTEKGTIQIEVEQGTERNNLAATFTLSAGATATVNETLQESEITMNDFSRPLRYTVTAEDGTTREWVVTVTVYGPLGDFTLDTEAEAKVNATFSWTVAVGATEIEIQQSTDAGTTWTTAYTAPIEATANTAKVVGLTAGATYKFRLKVTDGNNAGESNVEDVTTTSSTTAKTYGAEWDSNNSSTDMTRRGGAENAPKVSEGANPEQIENYFNDFAPWNEMKLCNVNDNGEITAYINQEGFERDNPNKQVMVYIPKFYYKHTYEGGVHKFWVADGPAAGFKLHPAFIRAGVEKSHILMGAYKAGEVNDGEKIKLTSVSGALPAVSRNRATFRIQAQNRGNNWCIVDALARNAVALLYLVEYADTNSQATIGQGITGLRYSDDDKITVASTEPGYTIIVSNATAEKFSVGQLIGVSAKTYGTIICRDRTIESIQTHDDNNKIITVKIEDGALFSTAVSNIIHHVGQKTGGCDGLGNASGGADDIGGNKASVSYRGLEDLWGNVWEFVDGMNIKNTDKQPYVADSGFVDGFPDEKVPENYKASGLNLPLDSGYVSDFAYSVDADWLLMPSEVEKSIDLYIPDYYYQDWANTEENVALVGGRLTTGTNAGLFAWAVNVTPSHANLLVGARLVQIP